jgi:integrase
VRAWPEPDQAAWAKAVQIGSPLEPGGWASLWAPLSRKKAETDYGRWIAWLERQGELDLALAPEARATRERLGQYLKYLQSDLSTFSVQSALQGLGDVLRVMTETHAFGWISKAAARLRTRATSTKSKRQKIRSPDQLVDLGVGLMAGADILGKTDAAGAALQYRNGLIIAFLAYCPIRAANLAMIAIGEHLVKRGGAWWLMFAAAQTKQRRHLEFPFPVGLAPALEHYLMLHRPVLAAKGAHRGSARAALWISQDGGVLTAGGMSQAIQRLTKAAFGASINPHLFRDCAATGIAIDAPEHAHIIAPILGHSSATTGERHYNQARGLEAGRLLHVAVGTKRANAKLSRKDNSRAIGTE